MAIYTKKGDDGTTTLFGGKRLFKDDIKIEAYGTVDEVTSIIGLILSCRIGKVDREILTLVQQQLYGVMAYLSGAGDKLVDRIEKETQTLEKQIDKKEKNLPKLTRFILPQGSLLSVFCHLARVATRRCERRLVSLNRTIKKPTKSMLSVVRYVNRLSDYLFVLSRWYNKKTGDFIT